MSGLVLWGWLCHVFTIAIFFSTTFIKVLVNLFCFFGKPTANKMGFTYNCDPSLHLSMHIFPTVLLETFVVGLYINMYKGVTVTSHCCLSRHPLASGWARLLAGSNHHLELYQGGKTEGRDVRILPATPEEPVFSAERDSAIGLQRLAGVCFRNAGRPVEARSGPSTIPSGSDGHSSWHHW